MDGTTCILNHTGMALAQATAEIARLNAEVARLENGKAQGSPSGLLLERGPTWCRLTPSAAVTVLA